jgi:hypothetical protein
MGLSLAEWPRLGRGSLDTPSIRPETGSTAGHAERFTYPARFFFT